jgi:hypothetical protein
MRILSLSTTRSAQTEQERASEEWVLEHTQDMHVFEKLLMSTKAWALRVASFFQTAPDIEGIDPTQQERNYIRLLILRLSELGLGFITPAERKKLGLSSRIHFYESGRWGQKLELAIDPPVIPLVEAINSISGMSTIDSCSGHIYQNPYNPKQAVVKDHGFVSFQMDFQPQQREHVGSIIEQLEELVEIYRGSNRDDGYYLRKRQYGSSLFLSLGWYCNDLKNKAAYLGLKKKLLDRSLPQTERSTMEVELFQLATLIRAKMETNQFENFIADAATIIRSAQRSSSE